MQFEDEEHLRAALHHRISYPWGRFWRFSFLHTRWSPQAPPSTSSRFCKQAVNKLLLHPGGRCLMRQVGGGGNLFRKMPLASHFLLEVVGGGAALKHSSRRSWHTTRSVSTHDVTLLFPFPTICAMCMTFRHRHSQQGSLIETVEPERKRSKESSA
jgi:hypothetical protein